MKIPGAEILKFNGFNAKLKINTKANSLNNIIKEIIDSYQVDDIDVQNASLEDVISKIYESKIKI